MANGFELHPSLPLGLFSAEVPVYVVFESENRLLGLPDNEVTTVIEEPPLADLTDVQTPPTPL